MTLRVHIATPEGGEHTLECDALVVSCAEGDRTVLPGHVPLLAALGPGPLGALVHATDHTIGLVMGSAETAFSVGRGFVLVEEDTVRVLTERCDPHDAAGPARSGRR